MGNEYRDGFQFGLTNPKPEGFFYLSHGNNHYEEAGSWNILNWKCVVESDIEPPPSPPSSYSSPSIGELGFEFGRPPPELPPQLPSVLPDEPPLFFESKQYMENWEHVPGLQPMMLNHAYIDSIGGGSTLGLRSTQRFHSEYVTHLAYYPLRK